MTTIILLTHPFFHLLQMHSALDGQMATVARETDTKIVVNMTEEADAIVAGRMIGDAWR